MLQPSCYEIQIAHTQAKQRVIEELNAAPIPHYLGVLMLLLPLPLLLILPASELLRRFKVNQANNTDHVAVRYTPTADILAPAT